MKQKKKETSIFTQKKMQKVYEIIKDETIENKLAEISKIANLESFVASLDYKFYLNFENERKFMKEWYKSFLESEKEKAKIKKEEKRKTAKNFIDHNDNLFSELNELYKNNNLNINTYYDYYVKYGTSPFYKKYLPNKNVFGRDSENYGKILEIIKELTTGQSLRNLQYRKSINEVLERNNYLENYNYAEFVINQYINNESSYKTELFYKRLQINENKFKYCVKLIQFVNYPLYEKYCEVKKSNISKRFSAIYMTFEKLSEKITEYDNQGMNYPLIDFFKMVPFKDNNKEFGKEVSSFITKPEIRKNIMNYIYKNNIRSYEYLNKAKLLSTKLSVNNVEITEDDMNNIFKIMEIEGLPIIRPLFLEVTKKYIKGEYNIEELERNLEEKIQENNSIIQNPFDFTEVETENYEVKNLLKMELNK